MEVSHRSAHVEAASPSAKSPLSINKEHTQYIGKLAKPGPLYCELVKEYRALFGVGESDYSAEMLEWSCQREGKFEITLLFVDEEVCRRGNVTWFCLKEIGKDASGDYHYLTLDQLVLCL